MKADSLDQSTHTYKSGLPSVTEILVDVGLAKTDFCKEEDMLRGTAVHLACQYYDEGDLDFDSLDPTIQGYVGSYMSFEVACGHKMEWIECPFNNGLYAGTPDRVCTDRPRVLIDLKTGLPQPWHKYQTAAYVNLFPDPYAYTRLGVYLQKDGSLAKVHEHPKSEYQRDLTIFLSALNVYNAKHGR